MASWEEHEEHCRKKLGKPYSEVHRLMDAPGFIVGKAHRNFMHDFSTALKIGRLFNDPGATQAALYHLQLDGIVDPRIDDALREGTKIAKYLHEPSPAVIFPLERPPSFRTFPLNVDTLLELDKMAKNFEYRDLSLLASFFALWDFLEAVYRFKDIDPEVKKIAEELDRGKITDLAEKIKYVLGKYFPYV